MLEDTSHASSSVTDEVAAEACHAQETQKPCMHRLLGKLRTGETKGSKAFRIVKLISFRPGRG